MAFAYSSLRDARFGCTLTIKRSSSVFLECGLRTEAITTRLQISAGVDMSKGATMPLMISAWFEQEGCHQCRAISSEPR